MLNFKNDYLHEYQTKVHDDSLKAEAELFAGNLILLVPRYENQDFCRKMILN